MLSSGISITNYLYSTIHFQQNDVYIDLVPQNFARGSIKGISECTISKVQYSSSFNALKEIIILLYYIVSGIWSMQYGQWTLDSKIYKNVL